MYILLSWCSKLIGRVNRTLFTTSFSWNRSFLLWVGRESLCRWNSFNLTGVSSRAEGSGLHWGAFLSTFPSLVKAGSALISTLIAMEFSSCGRCGLSTLQVKEEKEKCHMMKCTNVTKLNGNKSNTM